MQDLKEYAQDLSTTQVVNAMFVDLVTGTLNRLAFEKRESREVALIDVDSLKWVNDHLGHAAGDKLLVMVAEALQAEFGPDNVYRISGDEFAVRGEFIRLRLLARQDQLRMFSFGVAATLAEADERLAVDKEDRLLSGARARRGDMPSWAAQITLALLSPT